MNIISLFLFFTYSVLSWAGLFPCWFVNPSMHNVYLSSSMFLFLWQHPHTFTLMYNTRIWSLRQGYIDFLSPICHTNETKAFELLRFNFRFYKLVKFFFACPMILPKNCLYLFGFFSPWQLSLILTSVFLFRIVLIFLIAVNFKDLCDFDDVSHLRYSWRCFGIIKIRIRTGYDRDFDWFLK